MTQIASVLAVAAVYILYLGREGGLIREPKYLRRNLSQKCRWLDCGILQYMCVYMLVVASNQSSYRKFASYVKGVGHQVGQ